MRVYVSKLKHFYPFHMSGQTMATLVRKWLVLSLAVITTGALAQAAKPTKPAAASKASNQADAVPEGYELVNIDFPEPTDIKDIIRAVSLWTGKNVVLGKGVSGKVQMISPRKVTKEEAYQAFLSALNVLNLTTLETGKIIKIMPIRNALKGNLPIYQGSGYAPRTDKVITQIVPLKYIDAKQIQTTLSRIVTTNSMIAYPPTNTLIISDTGYKVRRILAIIELLDVQGQQPKVALVPIKYADAKVVSQKVSEILRASTKGKSKSSSANKYKISVDERSNSVVIFGPPRTIADVKNLVKQFDFPVDDPTNQAAIRVRFLNYADAKKLAGTLSNLAQGKNNRTRRRTIGRSTSKSNKSQANSSAGSTVADLGDNVKITADESSNALLITGSRAAYEAVNNLVRKLDQRRAQVYVEVDIIDVSLNDGFNFRTSVFAGAGDESGPKTIVGWQGADGIGPVIQAEQESAGGNVSGATAGSAVGALGSNFTIGILAGKSVDVPGLGKVTPGGLITMIKQDDNSRVLSSPHLLTSNNEEASITVGRKIFYTTTSQTALGTAGAVPKTEHEDVDLTLELRPNISHTGNYVTLKINLEANDGSIKQGLPDINKRKTSQIVTLKSGQTAVISGLIRTSETNNFKKIPLLGDIPILGWLFRNSEVSKDVSNLVFFITPYIVYGANDLARIYEDKLTENNQLMDDYFDDDFVEFTSRLPKLSDGAFKPNAFDEIELKNREKYLQEMREDMGFTDEDLGLLKTQPLPGAAGDALDAKSQERSAIVPGALPGDDGVESTPELVQPADQEPEIEILELDEPAVDQAEAQEAAESQPEAQAPVDTQDQPGAQAQPDTPEPASSGESEPSE